MENENHIKCLVGICEGLTWNESKILIVQKHGHEYWTQWVHRVNWSPPPPHRNFYPNGIVP